jgi:hypothetical protein
MTAPAGCSDSSFARACERGEILAGDFHHADHLRLALAYLCESDSVEHAAARMAATLRGFAARAGHPEKYHHTLTLFWIHKVAQLLDKELPAAYYSDARLSSAQARVQWIDPDRRPLDA